MSNLEKIRISVFKIWILTLIVIIAVFSIRAINPFGKVGLPFEIYFPSIQILIGLVIPQIGIMGSFYLSLDEQADKIATLPQGKITIIIWYSVVYHAIFIIAVILGIGFYKFYPSPDGTGLQRNTGAVVAITGLFSPLLAPIAFLFARPKPAQQSGADPQPPPKEITPRN